MHPYNWLTGHNINIIPGTVTNTISMDQVAARHLGPTWLPSLVLDVADRFHVLAQRIARQRGGADAVPEGQSTSNTTAMP